MNVGYLMVKEPETLQNTDALRAAVELVMVRRIRHIPILDLAGELIGIITDRDIKRALLSLLTQPDPEAYNAVLDQTKIEQVMTRDPVTVEPGTDLREAVQTMMHQKSVGCP